MLGTGRGPGQAVAGSDGGARQRRREGAPSCRGADVGGPVRPMSAWDMCQVGQWRVAWRQSSIGPTGQRSSLTASAPDLPLDWRVAGWTVWLTNPARRYPDIGNRPTAPTAS